MIKRLFDIVFASLGLLISFPVVAIAACGIRLSSPGPIFYLAPRVGRHGKPFVMYKLRTMRHRRHDSGSRITGVDDNRIFALGRWLRDWKLDELPQLLNVIRGEMSIVGPRPEDPEMVRLYYTAEHRQTLGVRPGLAAALALSSTMYTATICWPARTRKQPMPPASCLENWHWIWPTCGNHPFGMTCTCSSRQQACWWAKSWEEACAVIWPKCSAALTRTHRRSAPPPDPSGNAPRQTDVGTPGWNGGQVSAFEVDQIGLLAPYRVC